MGPGDAAPATCYRVHSVQAGGGTACAVPTSGGPQLLNSTCRLNEAVKPALTVPSNRGGPHVDYKRVIDLSPHRVDELTA